MQLCLGVKRFKRTCKVPRRLTECLLYPVAIPYETRAGVYAFSSISCLPTPQDLKQNKFVIDAEPSETVYHFHNVLDCFTADRWCFC
jgi:hypothetical protein